MEGKKVLDWDVNIASEEDFNKILNSGKTKTWDDFYKVLSYERSIGKMHCPQASYIALDLLTKTILGMPFKSARTNSETALDLINDAYLLITDKIQDFDASQSSFKTYMTKWFKALVRETREDGVSQYQKNKFNIHVVPVEALVKKMSTDDSEYTFDVIDENSSIEDKLEVYEKERSDNLLTQTMRNVKEKKEDVDKTDTYKNLTCYHLCLGGIRNMPDGLKDKLEDIVYT